MVKTVSGKSTWIVTPIRVTILIVFTLDTQIHKLLYKGKPFDDVKILASLRIDINENLVLMIIKWRLSENHFNEGQWENCEFRSYNPAIYAFCALWPVFTLIGSRVRYNSPHKNHQLKQNHRDSNREILSPLNKKDYKILKLSDMEFLSPEIEQYLV